MLVSCIHGYFCYFFFSNFIFCKNLHLMLVINMLIKHSWQLRLNEWGNAKKKKNMLKRKEHYGSDKILIIDIFYWKTKIEIFEKKNFLHLGIGITCIKWAIKIYEQKMKLILNLREICHFLPSLQYWYVFNQMSRFKYQDYLSQIWRYYWMQKITLPHSTCISKLFSFLYLPKMI